MIKTVLNAIIDYVPILLGAVFIYSALFRYPKPPVKLHWRLICGLIGAGLLYFGTTAKFEVAHYYGKAKLQMMSGSSTL
jgi:hypothetical protein